MPGPAGCSRCGRALHGDHCGCYRTESKSRLVNLPCPFETEKDWYIPEFTAIRSRGFRGFGWLDDVDALGSWGRTVRIVEENR